MGSRSSKGRDGSEEVDALAEDDSIGVRRAQPFASVLFAQILGL